MGKIIRLSWSREREYADRLGARNLDSMIPEREMSSNRIFELSPVHLRSASSSASKSLSSSESPERGEASAEFGFFTSTRGFLARGLALESELRVNSRFFPFVEAGWWGLSSSSVAGGEDLGKEILPTSELEETATRGRR
jgi:hypothetical protein